MTFKYTCLWPEALETGEIDYPDSRKGKGAAIADALTGWANCETGNKPPEKFGEGMVAIGKFVGITPTADNFMKAADSWQAAK